jgi:hypothetical protein
MRLHLAAILAFVVSVSAAAAPNVVDRQIRGNDNRGQFNIQYVELSKDAASPAVRSKVNAALATIAKASICEADPANRRRMSSKVDMKVSFINKELLAVEAHRDYYCGGPYPDKGAEAHLFDLQSGNEIRLEDQIVDRSAFRRAIVTKMLANLPKDKEHEDCKELYSEDQLRTADVSYLLKAGQLVVSPSYPHVTRTCEFGTPIPWSNVAAFMKPNSPLGHLLRR